VANSSARIREEIMRFCITVIVAAFVVAAAARAQTPTGSSTASASSASPSSSSVATTLQTSAATSNQQEPAVALKQRKNAPETPLPKLSGDEVPACPGGTGKACAMLGGRMYFSDALGLSRHSASWSDAAKSPGMLFSAAVLTASTVADIETTQACIHSHSCREADPLMGQSRAQAYSVAMTANLFVFWAAAEQKRHGHGTMPFFIMWCATAGHAALAAHNASFVK
jgi:hypothetical protein